MSQQKACQNGSSFLNMAASKVAIKNFMNLLLKTTKGIVQVIFFLLLCILVDSHFSTADSTSDSEESEMPNFIQHFSIDKYKMNTVYSPACAESCISMLYFGLKDASYEEVERFLGYNGRKKEDIMSSLRALHAKETKGEAALVIASWFYFNAMFTPKQSYQQLILDIHKATPQSVDFTEETRDSINTLVAEKTNDKIQNLIATPFDPSTRALLLSVIYLKAQWQYAFKENSTVKQKFNVTSSQSVDVDMMRQLALFRYAKLNDLKADVVELNLNDLDIKMIVILPHDIDGLAAVEKKLASIDLRKLNKRLKPQPGYVHLVLPKFKIETEIDLKVELPKMGVKKIFSESNDFEPMVQSNEKFSVSEGKQKAYINVDENGLEAAAATYMIIMARSLPMAEFEFIADHPFFFALVDADFVYFAGHVVNF